MSGNAWVLIEALVATVGRAFYTDMYIVVLDALVREKYIIEEELGPRLKLSAKEVRKITTQLETEMLIKTENVYIDNNRSFIKCYYIDYYLFYQVILYRIHWMQKAVISEERTELNEVFYQCPTCHEKSTSLQAMRLRSAEGKFVCSHCCPMDNIRTMIGESYYTLIEVDNRGKLNKVQLLEKKIEEQINKNREHQGIFQLLAQLGKITTPLPRNRPSDNISKGVRSSAVVDTDVAEDIENNMQFATGKFGSSLIRKALNTSTARTSNNDGNMYKTEFDINIISEAEESALRSAGQTVGSSGGSHGQHQKAMYENRQSALPSFLQDSRVIGASTIMKQAEALQQERTSSGPDRDEQLIKRFKFEAPSAPVDVPVVAQSVATAPVVIVNESTTAEAVVEEEDDDVAWESDGEEE